MLPPNTQHTQRTHTRTHTHTTSWHQHPPHDSTTALAGAPCSESCPPPINIKTQVGLAEPIDITNLDSTLRTFYETCGTMYIPGERLPFPPAATQQTGHGTRTRGKRGALLPLSPAALGPWPPRCKAKSCSPSTARPAARADPLQPQQCWKRAGAGSPPLLEHAQARLWEAMPPHTTHTEPRARTRGSTRIRSTVGEAHF